MLNSETYRKQVELKTVDSTPPQTRTWKHLARVYTLPLVTSRDTCMHLQHIAHRRIGTANQLADRDDH